MAELETQKSAVQQQEELQEKRQSENRVSDVTKLLAAFGGFKALQGLIPEARNMDPAKKAERNDFLSSSRFEHKRELLARELRAWLTLLDQGAVKPTELVEECEKAEQKYEGLLKEGISEALSATAELERAYRSLDSFFKNANAEKIKNLRLINVFKEDITDRDSGFDRQVDELLRNGFDQLSLKDSYSLMCIPDAGLKGDDLRHWAAMAYKYKVMLITDHPCENNFDDLKENTEIYRDSDAELMNVIMTANWIEGRDAEKMCESEEGGFYIPASGALAGKLYDETANMAQGAGGKKYGTINGAKNVKVPLLKSQIAELMDNQIVPMVISEGRVMAFNNTTLYNGDLNDMREYPIVRVFDWVKKVLMNYVHEVALENWDPYNSPKNLKSRLRDFLNNYKGYGKLFHDYTISEPVFKDGKVTCDIKITPFNAAKNFVINVRADRSDREATMELE